MQVRNIIKMIVLQMLFDSEHLENYITRKIHQFSSNVQIVENISQALQTPEAERIIDKRLDYLYSQPEAYYLQALGLSRERIKPMIRPAVISLCAESAPYVLDMMHRPDVEQVRTYKGQCTWSPAIETATELSPPLPICSVIYTVQGLLNVLSI